MANELKHKVVGTALSRTEWEDTDTHEADGETTNDMLYFNGTNWVRATQATIAGLIDGEIKLDDLKTPDDNTDLDASTTEHGLLLKLDNVSTNFLNGQGAWAAPAGAGADTALSNLASVAINESLISDTDDTDDLGSSSKGWKDVYLKGDIELGHASDTTIARVSAGLVAVEGSNLIRASDVDDTPVNGQTAVPVSSNWAYDHDNDADVHDATAVNVSELGTATYDDAQDFVNFFGNRTLLSGGGITAHGDADGSVVIAACTAWAKISNSDTAVGNFFDYAGKAKQTLTDLHVNLIYLDYNGGVPQIVVATTPVTYGFQQDHILIGVVFQQGNAVHIFQSSNIGIQGINRAFMHQVEHHGAHRSSGLVTSDGGTLALSITSGIIYAGLNRQATTVNGSTWSYWYTSDSGSTWTEDTGISALVQSYNNIASGKVSLGSNKFGVHWVYVDYEGSHLHIVYGQGNYTAPQAEEAGVPAVLPPIVVGYGVLIAKIINQEGTNTLTISYPWTTVFTSSLATDHGSLAGLSDDDHAQYIKDSEFTQNSGFLVGTGAGTFAEETGATVRTSLGLAIGTNVAAQTHASQHDSGGADQIHSIADDDDDTKIQVEESADEDIIRMDTTGAEVFNMDAAGILTLAKQVAAKAYQSDLDQGIPDASWTHLCLDTEEYDVQNEFDTSVISGAADATEASKLHDTDGGFSSGDVGKTVWNTTDNTYTTVSGFVDSGELDLTDDIMVDTEGYSLYFARYTTTVAGRYLIVATITWKANQVVADKVSGIVIYKNGSLYNSSLLHTALASYWRQQISGLADLAVSDYLDLRVYQAFGAGVKEMDSGTTAHTFLAIQKVS